jgi:hypothetical protein
VWVLVSDFVHNVGALHRYVEGVDAMFDRTGNLDMITLMGLTYTNGLPIYAANPAVQQVGFKPNTFCGLYSHCVICLAYYHGHALHL